MGFQLLILHLIRKTILFGEKDWVCDGQFNMLLCPAMLSCDKREWQFGCCGTQGVVSHFLCLSSSIKFYIEDINIATAMTSQRPSSNMDQHVLNLAKIENVH